MSMKSVPSAHVSAIPAAFRDLEHLRGIREHRDDYPASRSAWVRLGAISIPAAAALSRACSPTSKPQQEPGGGQVGGHRQAHHAQADEGDGETVCAVAVHGVLCHFSQVALPSSARGGGPHDPRMIESGRQHDGRLRGGPLAEQQS